MAAEKKAAPAAKPAAADTKAAPAGKPEAAKASKEAKAVAGKAEKKAKAPKADMSGKYKLGAEAAKVKSTDELGMHEESVRTKVLAVVFGSKAAGGVDFTALVTAGGDQTRGAVAYLVKRGFLVKAA